MMAHPTQKRDQLNTQDTRRLLSKSVGVSVFWAWLGCGRGLGRGGVRLWAAGSACGWGLGQVMAQVVPLWWSPRLVRRWRLTAAARSRSQCRLLAVPR